METVRYDSRVADFGANFTCTPGPASWMIVRAILCVGCAFTLYSGAATNANSVEYRPTATTAAPVPTCKTNLTTQLQVLDVPGLSAAIVKDGRLVCTVVAGMANIEQDRPVTSDTLFLVASVSKTITATALMKLYEQGKFRLDDDINKYLPFKVSIPASPTSTITFRHLLTHTSSIKDNNDYFDCPGSCGYGSTFGDIITRGADSPISLADFTKGYLSPGGTYYDRRDNFHSGAPGTVDDYSNMGIVLAGYLAQVISGTPFDQYCKDYIFKPLGMEKTSWRLAEIDQSMLAMPYDKSSSGYVPYGHYGQPNYPDGMLRTSVNELSHFLIAYMQGGRYNGRQILRSTTVREMLKNQTSLDLSQGLAWSSRSLSGLTSPRVIWGHDGADFGARARMWFDPAKKVGVILMTNGVWRSERARALFTSLFQEADEY